jgi:hypothetical protein
VGGAAADRRASEVEDATQIGAVLRITFGLAVDHRDAGRSSSTSSTRPRGRSVETGDLIGEVAGPGLPPASMTMTVWPAAASRTASGPPPAPEPTTT